MGGGTGKQLTAEDSYRGPCLRAYQLGTLVERPQARVTGKAHLPRGGLSTDASAGMVQVAKEVVVCTSSVSRILSQSYAVSKPLSLKFRVRLFSVTIRTTCSGAPSGMLASISRVSFTSAPSRPAK